MLGQPKSRQRGLLYSIAGVLATLACTITMSKIAGGLAARNVSPTGPAKFLMASIAIGMAAGLCLVYVGLARLVVGAAIDKVDFKRISLPGLLYVLGFAAMLALAGYIVIGVYQIDPISMRHIGG